MKNNFKFINIFTNMMTWSNINLTLIQLCILWVKFIQ